MSSIHSSWIHLPHAHSSHSLPVPMSSVYSPKQAQHSSVLMLSSINRGTLGFGSLSAVGDVPVSELAAIHVCADVHVLFSVRGRFLLVGAAFPFKLAVAFSATLFTLWMALSCAFFAVSSSLRLLLRLFSSFFSLPFHFLLTFLLLPLSLKLSFFLFFLVLLFLLFFLLQTLKMIEKESQLGEKVEI